MYMPHLIALLYLHCQVSLKALKLNEHMHLSSQPKA